MHGADPAGSHRPVFGRADPVAVFDNLGVDPGFTGRNVARALMSQLLLNLSALRVETMRTEVDWNSFQLLGFLAHSGFTPSQELAFRRPVG